MMILSGIEMSVSDKRRSVVRKKGIVEYWLVSTHVAVHREIHLSEQKKSNDLTKLTTSPI